jgi:hypothetical protein
MSSAFSQSLLASHTKEAWGTGGASAVKAEAKAACRWEFYSTVPDSFSVSQLPYAEEEDFGQRVACLKALVEQYYIHREEVVLGDPTMRTIIRKPNIYHAARKVEKHLKKEIKKGNLTVQQAAGELAFVLEVAIAAVDEPDTYSFETLLSKAKGNAAQQINLFKQVKITRL